MSDLSKPVLWGVGTSRTFRPHWALHELGLDYDTKPITTRTSGVRSDEFGRFGSNGKIPVLQDGDLVLRESAAMVTYLGDRYGDRQNRLVPAFDTSTRAHYDQWCFFVMTELDATSLYVLRRHQDLASIYGDAPAAVDSARAYFLQQLSVAEKQLATSPYILGSNFSGADILLVSCLDWAVFYGFDLPTPVQSYHARATDREAYQRAFALNFPAHILEALATDRTDHPS